MPIPAPACLSLSLAVLNVFHSERLEEIAVVMGLMQNVVASFHDAKGWVEVEKCCELHLRDKCCDIITSHVIIA